MKVMKVVTQFVVPQDYVTSRSLVRRGGLGMTAYDESLLGSKRGKLSCYVDGFGAGPLLPIAAITAPVNSAVNAVPPISRVRCRPSR